jgi:predicted nuclease with RNAse H fold
MSLHAAAVPLVIVSDFGRDAALRFCSTLAAQEREELSRRLPKGAAFYDEYRRITLHLVGDLPFVKSRWLASYVSEDRLFDDRVLVGFSGGPRHEDVVAPIGALIVEALAGPASRGCTRAVVALPCNTLAPVSWALEEAFSSRERLESLCADCSDAVVGMDAVVNRMVGRVGFPTVPEGVLWHCRRSCSSKVLPLGTPGVVEIYRRTAADTGEPVTIVSPDTTWQQEVLEAIGASIASNQDRRRTSKAALEAIGDAARARWGEDTAVIEACTDLDYGVGIDSGRAYAEYVQRQVYEDDSGESRRG